MNCLHYIRYMSVNSMDVNFFPLDCLQLCAAHFYSVRRPLPSSPNNIRASSAHHILYNRSHTHKNQCHFDIFQKSTRINIIIKKYHFFVLLLLFIVCLGVKIRLLLAAVFSKFKLIIWYSIGVVCWVYFQKTSSSKKKKIGTSIFTVF